MLEKGSFINNRYEIINRVGAGGMSDVYKAKDHKLNRNVAMKVLKREFSKDKNFVSKFRVEAQSAASLIHPNIVNVYDVGEENGTYYIVMELIEGITLKNYIEKKGRLSARETISIAIQIANGIECAHNNQIIHRDIKPQNIMISREGKVKVTDFGIARAASANTINGNAMGSVHYISPEQAGGKYVDEKSDIYSLGITMYEMLTGTIPFDGESTVSIALMHIQKDVPSVREILPNVPVSIEKIVLKCTQNKAERRYPKISSLIADLKRALVEPEVDFVHLDETQKISSTIRISDDQINKIREQAGKFESSTNINDYSNDDIDAVSPKMDRVMTIGGVVVGIFAFVIVAVLITNATFSYFYSDNVSLQAGIGAQQEVETLPEGKAKVPSVLGLSQQDAETRLNENRLGCDVTEWEYSDEYKYGQIVRQDITPGTVVDTGSTTVHLVASYGSQKVRVPDGLKGEKVSKAIEQLEEQGFEYDITYEFSSEEIDTVISYSPNEKAEVSKGEVIQLTVSRGKQSTGELSVGTVPNVVGKTQAKAQEAISAAGYNSGSVKRIFSDEVKKDCVIRQSIQPGAAPYGISISLIVSDGPENAEKQYKAVYTVALEDLLDENGNPITSGTVTAVLNGEPLKIDEAYAKVEDWDGDYTMQLTGSEKGNATLYIYVNGVEAFQTNVRLK